MHITTNLVHQIQAGSASPSTFAVHLEEYLRPLGCSEFSGGTASFLIVIGGIIVRELRSAAAQSLKHPALIYGLAFAVSVVTLLVAYFPF